MTVFDRRPSLRWTVPAAVGLVIAATVVGAAGATADSGLPPRTPQELLVALQEPRAQAISGTVAVTTDLGLPALPASMGGASSGPAALLSGTHTVRVWSDGGEKARVALLGRNDEYDVIRNGSDVWTWSSAENSAGHLTLPAKDPDAQRPALSAAAGMPSTPQEAADLVLAVLDPTTAVTTTGTNTVAGRAVYELVLTPKQAGTRIDRVVVAMDAETSVPLSVRVYSTQASSPAIDIGFTSVDFAAPDASVFTFTPPPGATVTELGGETRAGKGKDTPDRSAPSVVGQGWTTVLVLPGAPEGTAVRPAGQVPEQLASVLSSLPEVSGAWGTGRMLDGALVSVILADDGRLAIGAVTPAVLEAALAAR